MLSRHGRAAVIGHFALAIAATMGCGEDFEPPNEPADAGADAAAGGATGGTSGASGSAGAAGSSAGTAGSGGTGAAECTALGAAIEVIAPSELGPTQTLEGSGIGLVRQDSPETLHLAVVARDGNGKYALLMRSLMDSGSTSALATWNPEAPGGGGPKFHTGTAISTEVRWFGFDGNQLKSVTLATGSSGATPPTPVANQLSTPTFCGGSEDLLAAKFSFASASDYRVALSCSVGTETKLFVGGSATVFDEVDSGDEQDGTLTPARYVYSGNRHLILNAGNVFRFGTNASELAATHALSLDSDASVMTQGISIVPLKPPAEGSVVFAGAFKGSAVVPAELSVAALTSIQYADLGAIQPASFKSILTIDKLFDVPTFAEEPWLTDGESIVAASTTIAQDRVLFWQFDRSGAALVLGHQVATMPAGSTVLSAHASQLGFSEVVVWLVEDSTGARSLMAQRMVCGSS